jgi:hypothetical protein
MTAGAGSIQQDRAAIPQTVAPRVTMSGSRKVRASTSAPARNFPATLRASPRRTPPARSPFEPLRSYEREARAPGALFRKLRRAPRPSMLVERNSSNKPPVSPVLDHCRLRRDFHVGFTTEAPAAGRSRPSLCDAFSTIPFLRLSSPSSGVIRDLCIGIFLDQRWRKPRADRPPMATGPLPGCHRGPSPSGDQERPLGRPARQSVCDQGHERQDVELRRWRPPSQPRPRAAPAGQRGRFCHSLSLMTCGRNR